MAPWGTDSHTTIPASAEKALSLISKSWFDVRKSANEDVKRMKDHAISFSDLANSFDRELKNFRKSSLKIANNASIAECFLQKFQNGGTLLPSLNVSVPEEVNNKLKISFSGFSRSYSNPDFVKRQADFIHKWAPSKKLDVSLIKKVLSPRIDDQDFYIKTGAEVISSGKGGHHGNCQNNCSQRVVVKSWANNNKHTKNEGDDGRGNLTNQEWELLRRFKESWWKDLETTVAVNKSPSDFFDNITKTEIFESLKKNLRLTVPRFEDGKDVAPLDVSELLAILIRQSEPWLDYLGLKKDVVERVCDMLVKGRHKNKKEQSHSIFNGNKEVLATMKDTGKNMEELDFRLASVMQSTGYNYNGRTRGRQSMKDVETGMRNIAIFTTASLPWMTGTAVNPLLRAAYLAKNGKQNVTLLVPWLCKKDQKFVYPNNMTFDSPEEQEGYVRNWLESRLGFKSDFKIAFYPGKFSKQKRSILACGDISQFVSDQEADIAVLEEPEHLTWYFHGKRWTDKFKYVVGVVHTNYLEYVKREKNGALQAFLLKHVNNWVTRIYCDKVLRLSAATQELPRSIVCNVHGVNPKFLEIGEKMVQEGEGSQDAFSKGAYFLGKMVWGKGYRELVDLLAKHKSDLGSLKIDVFGTGEDSEEVKATAKKLGLDLNFNQGRDHADDCLHGYKVFINPSISDVVCTTTAEALAMGKIVVCADHPSNDFFRSFPNCLTYKDSREFVEKVKEAMAIDPVPLTPEQRHLLSWEAATERFIEYAEIDNPFIKQRGESVTPENVVQKKAMALSMAIPNPSELVDNSLAAAHYCLTGIEAARLISGALPGSSNYDSQHSKDLHLRPPSVERPVYGW